MPTSLSSATALAFVAEPAASERSLPEQTLAELAALPVLQLGEIACSGPAAQRKRAVRALARRDGELARGTLLRCAASPLGAVRLEAIHALARQSAPLADLVRLRTKEESSWIRQHLDSLIANRSA